MNDVFGRGKKSDAMRKLQDTQNKETMENIAALWGESSDTRKALDDFDIRLKNLEDAVYEMQNGMIAEVLHRDMKEVMARHRPLSELEKERLCERMAGAVDQ